MTFVHMQHRVTIASALGLLLIAFPGDAQTGAAAAEDTAIRPFRIRVPDAELVELQRRIAATRWPEKETVADHSQGVPLAMVRELARYWASEYDWRKGEAKLNAVPQIGRASCRERGESSGAA